MKKNFTINLYGMLFNIDEDAYQLLENYLRNMRDYFSKRDGGEEISDDIERRVAELLSEQKEAGIEAVTIENIQDIMKRIGNPQEMDCEDEDRQSGQAQQYEQTPPPIPQFQEEKRRKFYLDGRDKMLGGVLSGMCKYFGGTNVLPWRIIFILLCFVSVWGAAIVYMVLWALIPEAKTAEERLLMCGKPVTQENLNNEIMYGMGSATPAAQGGNGTGYGCLTSLLTMLVTCLKVAAMLILIGLFIGLIIFLGITLISVVCVALDVSIYFLSEDFWLGSVMALAPSIRWWALVFALSGLIVTFIPLYALFKSMTLVKAEDSMRNTTHWGLIATWIVALVIAVVSFIGFISQMVYYTKVESDREHAEYVKENTRNGMYLTEASWEFLTESGWKILKLENADNDIMDRGESMEYKTQEDVSYEKQQIEFLSLEQENKSAPMLYDIGKTLEVAPGLYRLAALLKTDGQGNAFYAKMGGNIIFQKDINEYMPADTSATHRTTDFIYRKRTTPEMDKVLAEEELIPFDVYIQVKERGTLDYGFSNDKALRNNPWTATEFKVVRMRLELVDENTVK